MNIDEVKKELKDIGPWVDDQDQGTYCFYCDCTWRNVFHGKGYTHEKDCLYLRLGLDTD